MPSQKPFPPKPNFQIPHVKKYKSHSLWSDAAWNALLSYLTSFQNKDALKLFIEIITTPDERAMITRRAAIIERVLNKIHYRAICEELRITPQTLNSLKKALSEKQYRSYRERGKTERTKRTYSPLPEKTKRKSIQKRRTKFGTISMPFPS
ncbi:MAG: Trp family transcriptional regulator [Patescibacteria group bacterium]